MNYHMKNLKAYLMTFLFYITFTAFYVFYNHENYWHYLIGFLIYAAFVLFFITCIPSLIRRYIFQKTICWNDSVLNGLVLVLGFLFLTFLLRHNGIYRVQPATIDLITSIYMIFYVNCTIKNLFGVTLFGILKRKFIPNKSCRRSKI